MVSVRSRSPEDTESVPSAIKILVSGGFGVGKTTMVGSVSEVEPLRTEETITAQSVDVDDLSGIENKTTTTVAMDFGRITIDSSLLVYLFGTPGQDRFWFMWDELVVGALGAVVLVDTRRLADCFGPIDFFEQRNTPFVVVANCFDNARRYTAEDIRVALDVDDRVPVLLGDVRERESSKEALLALLEHVMSSLPEDPAEPTTAGAPA